MKRICTLTLVVLGLHVSGCLQTENTASLYGESGGGAGFEAARTILNRSCSASSCHPEMATAGEQAYIDIGRVIPGDPDNSPIYFRLIGSSSPRSESKSMPQSGAALTNDEIQTIYTWVQNATGN